MIRLSALTKRYGETVVLDGIDLSVEPRQIAAIVGASGAGKSTLARLINVLERPTSGSIHVDGQELTSLRPGPLRVARQSIGTVFQSANLLSRLTVAQNVALPLRQARMSAADQHDRVRDLLDRVGLLNRANHYPSQLSGGQRQRVGIARGLALRPKVLLADEATSGLDPHTTTSILGLLTELRDELGLTIVLITHEMDVVRSVADVVAHLDHGRIVAQGSVAEVIRSSASGLSRALLPLPPAAVTDGQVWELRYSAAAVDPTWVLGVARTLGVRVSLLSAHVEAVAGDTVGRATVALGPAAEPIAAIRAFESFGIDAELLASPAPQWQRVTA